MEIVRTADELRARLAPGDTGPAFVPTMGWLHEGHLSLVRRAAGLRPLTVVSVFVNPTQFGPGEDFARYPRDLGRDAARLAGVGAGLLFAPEVGEIYPPGFETAVEVPELSRPLCGRFRPGHFRGVATVVARLFGLVRPEVALFGEKDWQQLQIIRRMVRDLALAVEVLGCPTVRETDGLAMSSRNDYLSAEERVRARCLSRALFAARDAVAAGERDGDAVRGLMRATIEAVPGTVVDYVAVTDPESLAEQERIRGPVRLLVAVRLGSTRLIDNLGAAPPVG